MTISLRYHLVKACATNATNVSGQFLMGLCPTLKL
jgi:hypothetical protein